MRLMWLCQLFVGRWAALEGPRGFQDLSTRPGLAGASLLRVLWESTRLLVLLSFFHPCSSRKLCSGCSVTPGPRKFCFTETEGLGEGVGGSFSGEGRCSNRGWRGRGAAPCARGNVRRLTTLGIQFPSMSPKQAPQKIQASS